MFENYAPAHTVIIWGIRIDSSVWDAGFTIWDAGDSIWDQGAASP
jgi:hypothetical protein